MANLNPEQADAILEFAKKHGADWKEKLAEGWMKSAFPGPLQQVRNTFGPKWLATFDLTKPGS